MIFLYFPTMLILLTIALVAANAWGLPQPRAGSEKRLAAQQLFRQTLSARPALSLEEYIRQLERVTALDGKFAEAFHELGRAYIQQETIAGRDRAVEALERAMQLAPQNTEYRYTMAKLQLRRGAHATAKSEFRKIIKLDPMQARAHYELALFYEEDMLHYRDMISPHENATLYFYEFANKDFLEAERLFRSAIGLDPQMAEAYHHLAGLYFDAQLHEKMAALMERATAKLSTADLFLFLGLARQQLGKPDAAMQAYQKALELMPPADRALFYSLQTVLSPDSLKIYERAPDSLQTRMQQRFWTARDPLFLTEANERLLEHFGRIAYANLRYGVPEKNIAGWKTDRGQTLIRFGHPRWRTRTGADLGSSATGRVTLNTSKEFWNYGDFQMVFEDRFLNWNYAFAWGSVGELDGKVIFDDKIRELPERYEFPHGGGRLKLPHVIAQFRDRQNPDSTKVEIYFGVADSALDATKPTLQRGLFFFNENWDAVRQWREKCQLVSSTAVADHLAARWPVRMKPGAYQISLEVLDPKSGRSGAEREKVVIEDFSSERLHMSSVVLAVSDSASADLELYRDGEVHLVPVFFQEFFEETPIYVYYEIYNLALDAGGQSHYQIDYVVEPAAENKSLISRAAIRLGKLLGWHRQSVAIGSTFEATGGSPEEKLYQRLEILGQPAGHHHLTIRVTDRVSDQSAWRRVSLAIKPKNKNND
ncbi:MAG: GWxTD domain-containing protein [candidate division KSB1 bacterium]|nr:GWxTD domain-containing protein [candidate division KSB1 bacterium]MDZ7403938.1 GWxTD domain-containing protein [candidate division KSB1 bacterium]